MILLLLMGGCADKGDRVPQSSQHTFASDLLKVSVSVQETEPDLVIGGKIPLHVVIENISSAPQNVFEEWNSFGYFALTLEYATQDGVKGVMCKRIVGWTRNWSTFIVLQPGQVLVRDVFLDPKFWSGLPTVRGDATIITVKAIFTQGSGLDDPVWQGKIESLPVQLKIGAR
jgi:hypothetical protein